MGGWVGSTVSKLFLDFLIFFYIYKVPNNARSNILDPLELPDLRPSVSAE